MRGGLKRARTSRLVDVSFVRSPNRVVRAAVTTMRALPGCRSGSERLPIGRVMRIRSGVSCSTLAEAGWARENNGVLLPSCSRTMSRRESFAFGAVMLTSSTASKPTILVGWRIWTVGAAPRPATMKTTAPASATTRSRPTRYRIHS